MSSIQVLGIPIRTYTLDQFNDHVGTWSETLIEKDGQENYKQRARPSQGEGLVTSFWNNSKGQAEKALVAYNIKVTIYNVSTVVAIAGAAAAIFGGALFSGLILAAAGLFTREFVHQAMSRTVLRTVGNADQYFSQRIFKSFTYTSH